MRKAEKRVTAGWRTLAWAFALVFAAGAVPGCSCAAKPEIRFEVARMRGIEMDLLSGPQMIVDTTVKVKNRMSADLTVRAIRANVTIAGHSLAPVDLQLNQVFPGKEDKLLTFAVKVPARTALGILQATAGKDKLPYKVIGTADVTAYGIDANKEPVDEEGTIPRAKVLEAVRGMLPTVSIQ